MKSTLSALMLVLALLFSVSGCRAPSTHAGQGALMGGLGGAALGAALGSKNGDAGSGALIGSAVGALGGALVGNSMDESERTNAIIQERMGRRIEGAVTFRDVSEMTSAGVADDVIVTHIKANGVAQHPKVADVIKLTKQGVSELVITAMQETPLATASLVRKPRPVYVQEHYYVDPYPHYDHHPIHHGPFHHRPVHHEPHVDWNFSFGH